MIHPLLFTGVILVGLPILLHLMMKREPKKQLLPTFRFLKQKQTINQRKLRIRHLFLLALRMILIAVMCLALYQPTIVSDGFQFILNQPVSAILVVDTSSSMGYILSDRSGLTPGRRQAIQWFGETGDGPWTCLDDARYRALEIIDQLPPGSKIAVLDTGDYLSPTWSMSIAEARKKIINLKLPLANSRSVTQTVEAAYRLWQQNERNKEGQENQLPRLLCVFSDRTLASWEESRLPNLVTQRDKLTDPIVQHLYFDVGVDKPSPNMGIVKLELANQVISTLDSLAFKVDVHGTVPNQDNVLNVKIHPVLPQNETSKSADDNELRTIHIGDSGRASAIFRKPPRKAGWYAIECQLTTADSLPYDNYRYAIVEVKEPIGVLTGVEVPLSLGILSGNIGQHLGNEVLAGYWRITLEARGRYQAVVHSLDEMENWGSAELAKFPALVLLAVEDISPIMWQKLDAYVRAGGQLILSPGERLSSTWLKDSPGERLLPAYLQKLVELDSDGEGVSFPWNAMSYQHPLLQRFGAWRNLPNIDFYNLPLRTWRYWIVDPVPNSDTILKYADHEQIDQRHAAIIEKRVEKGRVILLTTDWTLSKRPLWHNYNLDRSFYHVMSNELLRYLIGDFSSANWNFTSGESVRLKPPIALKEKLFYLSGPDILDSASTLKLDSNESVLTLSGDRFRAPGNFRLLSADRHFEANFSCNPNPLESNLEKVSIDSITGLLGKESLVSAHQDIQLKEILSGQFTQPIELFPLLMILLLLFMAFENWFSNRFYRQKGKSG